MQALKLLEAIDKETKSQQSEILGKANKEAEELISKAKGEAELIIKTALDGIDEEIRDKDTPKVRTDEKKIDAKLQKSKIEIIDNFFKQANQKLISFYQNAGYKKTFEKFFKEAEEGLEEDELVVVINPRDKSLISQGLTNKKITVQEDKSIIGGLILKSKDSKKTVYNTLGSRLNRVKPFLLPKIASMVFK